MSKILSTKEAAELLDVDVRRVQQLAEDLGLRRFGRQFVITDKDVKKMATRKTKRGREKGAKK